MAESEDPNSKTLILDALDAGIPVDEDIKKLQEHRNKKRAEAIEKKKTTFRYRAKVALEESILKSIPAWITGITTALGGIGYAVWDKFFS